MNTNMEKVIYFENRRSDVIKMPSCFNVLAITHKTNATSKIRQLNNHSVTC